MRSKCVAAAGLATAILLARGPALANDDDLIIPLKFAPTSKPGQIRAEIADGLSSRAVALEIEDARAVKSKDIVGEGTTTGDRTFRIRSAGHMPTFLKATLQDRFSTWGVLFDEQSNLMLRVRVTRYFSRETRATLNSTFTAEVQLPWALVDRAGHVFAEGTAMGTGKVKGRWKNGVNCVEVLSDGLERAAQAILSDAKLQESWMAAQPAPAPAGSAVAKAAAPLRNVTMMTADGRVVREKRPANQPKTPGQLLSEVKKLRSQQLGTEVLVAYVSKQTLAGPFGPEDLVAWKKSGVPDAVTKEAVKRAP